MSYGESERFYVQQRRRRRWATGPQGMQGYAAFLMGADPGVELGSVVGAESAAYDSLTDPSAARSIAIGVATGALTFLLNRWLSKVLS